MCAVPLSKCVTTVKNVAQPFTLNAKRQRKRNAKEDSNCGYIKPVKCGMAKTRPCRRLPSAKEFRIYVLQSGTILHAAFSS